jgi:two-component sensor histidine kinase
VRPFLRLLCRPYETSPHLIEVVCDPDLQMSAAHLGPVGMIASEALSNAVKHAFPDDRRGQIEVRLESCGGKFELVVRDDGEGLPATVTPLSGRALIATFARQLGGASHVGPGPEGGVEVRVTFPA